MLPRCTIVLLSLTWSSGMLILLVISCLYFLQNKDVTEAIQKVAAAYDCKIVEGVLSHQLKQFVIDGNKVVLSVSNADTKVDDAEFEENEVYAIDIVTSTGEGKVKIVVTCTRLFLLLACFFNFCVESTFTAQVIG